MSQHDFDIANQTASNARADINLALKALGSLSSGSTEPPTKYANQLWYDTANNLLKKRNEANSAWISLGVIDEGAGTFTPSGESMPDISISQTVWNLGVNTTEATISPAKLRASDEYYRNNNHIGWNQTWQDVKASRVGGVAYQNTTGRPIMVALDATAAFDVSVNGSTWIELSNNANYPAAWIIPNNHYYRLRSAVTITTWAELR